MNASPASPDTAPRESLAVLLSSATRVAAESWSADVWHGRPVAELDPRGTDPAGRARADALSARAHRARQGAWADKADRRGLAELAVAEVLAPLAPLGFSMMHDLHWPATGTRAATNVDHVLVGPTGVIVIDTLSWTGSVELRDGVLRQDGRRRDEVVTRALEVCRDLAFSSYLPTQAVQPVLCLTNSGPATASTLLGVDVVGLRELPAWILGKPTQLDPLQIARIAARIRDILPTRLAPSNVLPINPPLLEPVIEPEPQSRRKLRFMAAKRAS